MAMIIGKLLQVFYQSEDGKYRLYKARASGGKHFTAVFNGEDAPKPLKTVEYVMFGEWIKHKTYGKQFEISRTERYEPLSQIEASERKVRLEAAKNLGQA